MIVLAQDPIFLEWAERQLGVSFNRWDATTIAVLDGKTLRAVIVFTRWSTHNVELSVATDGSRRWFSRRLAECVFKYVFDQCKKARCSTVAERNNPKALALNDKLFHREGVLKHWFGPGEDGVVYGLTAAEWRTGKYRERVRDEERIAA